MNPTMSAREWLLLVMLAGTALVLAGLVAVDGRFWRRLVRVNR